MIAHDRDIRIKDKDGRLLMTVRGPHLVWSPQHASTGTAVKVDDNTVQINYTVNKDKTGKVKMTGTFKCVGNKISVQYDIIAPPGVKLGGTMYCRLPGHVQRKSILIKKEKGSNDITFRRYNGKNTSLIEVINGNAGWSNSWAQHIKLKRHGKDKYIGKAEFLVVPVATTDKAVQKLYKESLYKADSIVVKGNKCSMVAHNGEIQIKDKAGKRLMILRGLHFAWSPPHTAGGTATLVDKNTIKINYIVNNDKTGKVKAAGTFKCEGNIITSQYDISAPKGVKLGGVMYRRLRGKLKDTGLVKPGIWKRHEYGGQPEECKDIIFRRFNGKNSSLIEILGGNHNWKSTWGQHIGLKKNGKDQYSGTAHFMVVPLNTSNEAVASIFAKRPLALSLSTGQDFNIWETGQGNPEFTVKLTNTAGKELKDLKCKIQVHDFDGKLVLNKNTSILLKPDEIKNLKYKIVPNKKQECYFVEASVICNGKETFLRTMMAVMEPYEFKNKKPDIFGLAAHFDIPSKAAVNRLLKRMGVTVVRKGDSNLTMKEFGAVAFWHSNVRSTQWKNSPDKKTKYLKSELESCDKRNNPYWEFGNEWNMAKLCSGKNSDIYVKDWLAPLTKIRKAGKYKVKILSMGLAGPDKAFLKGIYDNGGWDMIDGIAFHPGRGNFTPDYTKAYWSYLGAIKAVKKVTEKYGHKPLWITEAYACTKPNSWWRDDYRMAPENIILTFALGMAEGVECVMFYMLHDSVWHNKGGVDQNDSEYHYGMLLRDGAVKPSVMAYCTAAEALDHAKFVKWLKLPGNKNKGLLFKSPTGQTAILWNRSEGYIQTRPKDKKKYASPEPWINRWKKSVELTVPVKGDKLTVIDCIGRRKVIQAENGKAKVMLTGAPLILKNVAY